MRPSALTPYSPRACRVIEAACVSITYGSVAAADTRTIDTAVTQTQAHGREELEIGLSIEMQQRPVAEDDLGASHARAQDVTVEEHRAAGGRFGDAVVDQIDRPVHEGEIRRRRAARGQWLRRVLGGGRQHPECGHYDGCANVTEPEHS